MSRFQLVVIVMIFIITALVITTIVEVLAGWGYQDYCSTTQIQKLQASGDYYSCLKAIK